MTVKILFADNDNDFLNTRTEFLERAGYDNIRKANSLTEAEWLLMNTNVHLAILDIRMRDDMDPYDKSGLLLAQQPAYHSIPKIILTDYAFYDAVRDALRQQQNGFRAAVDVIRKEDGPEALIAAISGVVANHVRINWDLEIDWHASDSFSLTRTMIPELEGERLLNFEGEFKDLLRRLFFGEEKIRIGKLLWKRENRIAVAVLSNRAGIKPMSFVVVCGPCAIINQEVRSFDKYAPKAPEVASTRLTTTSETMHFAAISYALSEHDFESMQTLRELYRNAPPKIFKDRVTILVQKTLRDWHQDQPIRMTTSLEYSYRQRLGLQTDSKPLSDLEKMVERLESSSSSSGVTFERNDGKVVFHHRGQPYSYTDPLAFLRETFNANRNAVEIHVPGILSGESIFTDSDGHIWLTDFADAGTAPLMWNMVELEANMRFDWTEPANFNRWQELEHSLTQTGFTSPNIHDLEPEVRKVAQAISSLRRLLVRPSEQDIQDYHLGIFFQATHKLAAHQGMSIFTTSEQSRLVHLWLAMAILADTMSRSQQSLATIQETSGELSIFDEQARIILIHGQTVPLPPQPFAILKYLFSKANQLCTKDELLKSALKGKYEENYLHTLIGRIRKTIEDDPENPRYLITEPNAGYRLIPKPK